MKKIILVFLTLIFLSTPSIVFSQSVKDVFGEVVPPSPIAAIPGDTGAGRLNTVINNIIRIIYMFAFIAVIFMFLLGAFQWITSAGDKDAVGKARGRITAALVGLALLAFTFFLLRILGGILGFQLF